MAQEIELDSIKVRETVAGRFNWMVDKIVKMPHPHATSTCHIGMVD